MKYSTAILVVVVLVGLFLVGIFALAEHVAEDLPHDYPGMP